jgi:hypothetical protein
MVHLGSYNRFHAHNCGFSSKFVTFDGKYPKCKYKINIYLINPIPGNPRPIFPGKRELNNRRDPGKSGTGNPGNETLGSTTYIHGVRDSLRSNVVDMRSINL